MDQKDILSVVLDTINDIKNTGFTPDVVDLEAFLGGELGVDSVEMLESWYEIEKKLNIKVNDSEKRAIYTLGDLIGKIEAHLPAEAVKS
ncbi:acyl carrier protein [Rouxiella badensis]|uniref:Acyl carrier protein n=1 Tax=Rouxiella badensis TaxID=1646377 RepID=A0A1X0WAR5_9GAMM|nr:acyl carrier protein [Rouxiella badensis]ORJ23872.1 acyl carrier protein [Rouxiella badensis]QII39184.1 acyl carrier protein [Rouxiella badensis]QOI54718.1 acyl carrier protein [Rouxiella badensis subsp. acadiensis]WAT10716.1 acyl carrier protein [Rouxiella badensis]